MIAGLVLSFTLVALGGSLLLGLLNLPQDIIRWAGIAVLIIIGVGLIVLRFQHILERPFQRFGQREVKNRGSGVGLALGAVFVRVQAPPRASCVRSRSVRATTPPPSRCSVSCYHAAEVRTVVAGSGDIVVRRDDGSRDTISIDGTPRSL